MDMNKGLGLVANVAIEFAKGLVIDTPSELFYFPSDVTRYLLGVDKKMGEGRNLSLGQAAGGIWRSYEPAQINPISFDNPVLGPVWRAADVAAQVVYGGLDLLSGHAFNTLFNDWLGLEIPYFAPSPQEARGMGREIGMATVMFATPLLKARAIRALGIESKPKFVLESPPFQTRLETRGVNATRGQATLLRPLPGLMILGIWPTVDVAVVWFRGWCQRRRKAVGAEAEKIHAELQRITPEDINVLRERAGRSAKALVILHRLSPYLPLARQAMEQISAQHGKFVLSVMSRLAVERGSQSAAARLRYLIERGEPGAIGPLATAATKYPHATTELCLAVNLAPEALRSTLIKQIQQLDVSAFVEQAKTDIGVVFNLEQLAKLGNETSRITLASLDVAQWINQVTRAGNTSAAFVLRALAKGNNEGALRAIPKLDVSRLVATAQRSQAGIYALGGLAIYGNRKARRVLKQLAENGSPTIREIAKAMVDTLTFVSATGISEPSTKVPPTVTKSFSGMKIKRPRTTRAGPF